MNDPDPFDVEERDRFLEYAERICPLYEQLIVKVMVYAGFRLGEALAMRLSHLDLRKRLYTMYQKVTNGIGSACPRKVGNGLWISLIFLQGNSVVTWSISRIST